MKDSLKQRVICSSPERVIGALDAMMPSLDRSFAIKLNLIKLSYYQKFGESGLFERVNNKTIAEIINAFSDDDGITEVKSGEIDGVKFVLYDKQNDDREAT